MGNSTRNVTSGSLACKISTSQSSDRKAVSKGFFTKVLPNEHNLTKKFQQILLQSVSKVDILLMSWLSLWTTANFEVL